MRLLAARYASFIVNFTQWPARAQNPIQADRYYAIPCDFHIEEDDGTLIPLVKAASRSDELLFGFCR